AVRRRLGGRAPRRGRHLRLARGAARRAVEVGCPRGARRRRGTRCVLALAPRSGVDLPRPRARPRGRRRAAHRLRHRGTGRLASEAMAEDTTDPVTCTIEDGVAVLRLDDGKVNVVSHRVIELVHAGLDQALEEASAVAIVGRAGKLSAGFDLTEMTAGP